MMKLPVGARRVLVVLALSAGLALPAAAQVMESSPDAVLAVIKSAGYDAKIVAAKDGAGPVITAFSSAIGGNFDVRFESCDDRGGDCEIIVFAAGFSFDDANSAASLESINRWNQTYWGKALLTDEKAMWITIELNARFGMAKPNFADTLEWFENTMMEFIDYIGWEPN
jgi:hypothetical protein